MRTEKEIMQLLIDVANQDNRIRAAYLEGSHVNPAIKKDIFQDYDVVYIVQDTRPFRNDKNWINRFGEILYMQYPEESAYFEADVERYYGWLMQFTDGNRLDLHVSTLDWALENLELYQILVDKDSVLPENKEITDEVYWVKRPSPEQFQCTCNEFWWCLNNVAKGLWRKEIPYVMDMLDFYIRPMLKRMLEWKIGMEHNFTLSVGKHAKYMNDFISETNYHQFLKTYSIAEEHAIWEAVFCMCDLFESTAIEVGETLEFPYNRVESQNSLSYLKHIKDLPADAEKIF